MAWLTLQGKVVTQHRLCSGNFCSSWIVSSIQTNWRFLPRQATKATVRKLPSDLLLMPQLEQDAWRKGLISIAAGAPASTWHHQPHRPAANRVVRCVKYALTPKIAAASLVCPLVSPLMVTIVERILSLKTSVNDRTNRLKKVRIS
jgi:hypothetical protein